MFVPQPRARQDGGGEVGVGDVDGDAGGDERGFACANGLRRVDAGAQVQPRAARCGVLGQVFGDFGIEDFESDGGVHAVFPCLAR